MLSELRRLWLWKVQARPALSFENRFFRALKKLFRQQEAIVLRNLNKIASQIPKDKEPKKDFMLDIKQSKEEQLLDKILFDLGDETERFAKAAKPHIQGAAAFSGNQAMPEIIAGIDFDSTNRNFLKAVDKKTVKFAKDVNETTSAKLKPKIRKAIQSGGGVEAVRENIQDAFKGSVRGSAPRSRLIARTEMVGSGTLGNIEAYSQSGVVVGKEWLTSRDDQVRDTHAEVDGQVVKLDENFEVGAATLSGPGALVSGDPSEIMNCRCVLLPARLPA